MRKNNIIGFLTLGIIFIGLLPMKASAEATDYYCFCGTDLSKVTAKMIKDDAGAKISANCFVMDAPEVCLSKKKDGDICEVFDNTAAPKGQNECTSKLQVWKETKFGITDAASKASSYTQSTISKFIPNCLLANPSTDKGADLACRDVSIFVYFLINIARYLFGVVGALALVMFVYGGFTLILSQGSSEKVKKGTEIIVASVIGLIIMFGAYMLVQFLGEAINVKTEFKLK